MSFSSPAGGPIASAFVEVTADTSSADEEVAGLIARLSLLDDAAERTGEGIEDAFTEALRAARRQLDDFGSTTSFSAVEAQAEVAGESIENSFEESQVQVDAILASIGGPELFAAVTLAAENAGESVQNSFQESARQSDEALDNIGGAGVFAPVVTEAEIAGERIDNSFREAAVQSRLSLGSIGTAGALLAGGLAVAVAAVVGFGIQSAASLEQTQIGFESLLGSAEEADAFIRELQQFAATTPFEFPGLANNARQLLAVSEAIGITQEQLIPTIGTIGDLTAVLGQPPEAIDRVVRALGQMGSRGRVTTEELLQLSEALPGFQPFQAMAEGLGITTAELQEQVSKGLIPADEGIAALLEGMKQFPGAAGAMAEQAQTLNGVLSTFKDTIGLALTDAFQPLIPTIKTTLTEATPIIGQALQGIAPGLSAIAGSLLTSLLDVFAGLAPGISNILGGLGQAFDILGPTLGTIAEQASIAFGPLVELLPAVAKLLVPILETFGALAVAVLPPLIKAITAVVTALTPFFQVAGEIIQRLASAFAPVLLEISRIFLDLGDVVAAFFQSLFESGVIDTFAEAFERLAPVLGEVAKIIGGALIQVFQKLAPSLEELINLLADSFAEVLDSLAPVLPELAEAFAQIAIALAEILVALVPLIVPLVKLSTLLITKIGAPVLLKIAEAFAIVATAIAELTVFLSDNAGPAFDRLVEIALTLWHEVLEPFGIFVATVLIAPFAALVALFTGVLLPAFQVVIDIVNVLWHTVLEPFIGFIGTVLFTTLKVLIALIAGPWIIAIAIAIEIWKVLWNNVLVPFAGFVAAVLTPVINAVASALSTVLKVALDAVIAAANFLWKNVLVPFGNFLSAVFAFAIGVATGAWNALKTAVDKVKDAVLFVRDNAIKPVVNFIRDTATPIVDAFKSAFSTLGDVVSDVAGVIEDIIGTIGDAISKAGDLISKLGNIPGAGVIGDILSLQHGGVIDRDQFAALHAPEVVIPLNEPKRALELAQSSGLLDQLIGTASRESSGLGGGGAVTGGGITISGVSVNFNGPVSAADAHAAADAFVDGVTTTLRRRQLVQSVRTI